MNFDIFRYKRGFITFTLILGYTFIHFTLTGLYSEITLETLTNFTVRLPYAQRLLVPALAHFGLFFFPIQLELFFFLIEGLSTSLFYFVLFKLLLLEFSSRQAQLLSWLFLLILPLVTVINYRLQRQGAAAVFYPSDTSALFFIALGFLICLKSKWVYFIPLVFLATLNRESSFLLILIIPALHWHKLRTVIKPILAAILAYLLARVLLLAFLHDLPGQIMEWYPQGGKETLFKDNLLWLLNEENLFLFVFCFAGLPLFWFCFFDYIPLRYRPLRYVTLFYFIMLMMVGRLMEARIFSEIIVLLYPPVCLGLRNWLIAQEPITSTQAGFVFYINRWAVLGIIVLFVLMAQPINEFIIRLFSLSKT